MIEPYDIKYRSGKYFGDLEINLSTIIFILILNYKQNNHSYFALDGLVAQFKVNYEGSSNLIFLILLFLKSFINGQSNYLYNFDPDSLRFKS